LEFHWLFYFDDQDELSFERSSKFERGGLATDPRKSRQKVIPLETKLETN
jgi:hypothetical protein